MTVYARLLGEDAMAALAPECRALHAGDGVFHGRITVEVTRNPVLRAGLRLAGFPLAVKDAELRFEKRGRDDRDVWTRSMAGQVMETVQWVTPGGGLAERMGAMVAMSRLVPAEGGLDLADWRFRFLGLPLPKWAAPRVSASERPEAGRYRFDISIGLPWERAPVLRYHGWLDVTQTADESG
ncbi:hypothetical protein FIU86_13685 [Roseovarius sp. THAF9]|uniref:DUF4166 domain-containing protein n=1 Tax=Roseovarius sp. THAF9 TaxID=2587847 RepID=UPI001267BF6E|nr:DUF4166 domain-containing protein [Roseovarius sp. THAF9]QFT93897.1 hypothetical protein FIU86_13685 [Roseovarius sp. THAF9]